MSFEPNYGQSDPDVQFLSRTTSYSLFLTPKQSVFVLQGHGADRTIPTRSVLRMNLAGANDQIELQGLNALAGKSNYIIGNQPEHWHTNIPTYAKVAEHGVYPGIDLVFYGNQHQLECDFQLSPEADAHSIAFTFQGAKRIRVASNGDLLISTASGDVRFRKPVAYQENERAKELVAANYTIRNRLVGFSLGKYDHSRPLIIDPILEYSTYIGGSNIDGANTIAVAPDKTAFIAGGTYSTDFPTIHPLQPNHGGPDDFSRDAFVAKISADGSAVLYATYIGGKNEDEAFGVAVDSFGDAYVTGTTESPDFPVSDTVPTFNPECGGDGQCGASWNSGGLIVSNGFVIKLNPEGSALLYSGFVGYYEIVRCRAIAVDANQIAYVTGEVSPNITPTVTLTPPKVPPPPFPVTPNAVQSVHGGGDFDAFLFVVSATGNSVIYSTYLGGSNEDGGNGVAVDANQNAYITGLTYSPDFPVAGAYQAANGGNGDAFVTKINTKSGSLSYSTFFGGANLDQGNAIAVDGNGNAYVTGTTNSPGLPSLSPYGGQGDAFVAKFNPSASGTASLIYFTYLGGSLADSGNGIAVDSTGNAYITGSTVSIEFPVAGAVFQTQYGGGNADAFVTKLDPTGATVIYSSYLGGSNTEIGYGIAVDTDGSAYVAGQTCSQDFPLANPEQPTYGGNCDAFASKVSILDGIILTPTALTFPSLNIGATSLPQTVKLVNGDNTVNISNISLTGTNPGDFAETTTCPNPGSLQPGAECSLSVTFSPLATGIRKAGLGLTYSINGSNPLLKPMISLTGSTSTVQLSASTLNFGTRSINTTSAAQPVTVTNIGSTALTISSVTASGDFSETDNCSKAPIQPGTNCLINVTYSPTAAGPTTGALAVNDDVAGSPQVVLLNGTGLQPDFAMTSTPVGSTVVAGNSTTFTVNISSISGYNQAIALACSGVPTGAMCSIAPGTVTPNANGSATATVTITTGVRTLVPPIMSVPTRPVLPFTLLLMLCTLATFTLLLALMRLQRRRAVIVPFCALLFTAVVIGACNGGTSAGGGSGTPAGTYQIVIRGTSGNLSHSTTMSLQVK
jgi:hypothetical protein